MWPRSTDNVGRDTILQQLLDEIPIELNALLVNRVVSATDRYQPRPRDREPVSLDVVRFQQRNVLLPEAVRVRSDVAVRAVSDLSRDPAERVPNRRSAAALRSRPFNLIARCRVMGGAQLCDCAGLNGPAVKIDFQRPVRVERSRDTLAL